MFEKIQLQLFNMLLFVMLFSHFKTSLNPAPVLHLGAILFPRALICPRTPRFKPSAQLSIKYCKNIQWKLK